MQAETAKRVESKQAQIKEEAKQQLPESASKHIDAAETELTARANDNSAVAGAADKVLAKVD